MLTINFQNVEEIIFQNQDVQNLLPSNYQNYIQQWKLAKRFPKLYMQKQILSLDVKDIYSYNQLSLKNELNHKFSKIISAIN